MAAGGQDARPRLVFVGGVVGSDVEPGPVVLAGAFRAVPGVAAHPLSGLDLVDQLSGLPPAAGSVGDPVGGRNPDRVAGPEFSDVPAQFAAAVDLVRGEPSGLRTVLDRGGDHASGLLGPGGEGDLLGNALRFAAFVVGSPAGREIQGAVDDHAGGVGDGREVHRDLAQTHPAQGAGVLPTRSHAVGGGLRIAGLVHHQHHLLASCGEAVERQPGDLLAGVLGAQTDGRVVTPPHRKFK